MLLSYSEVMNRLSEMRIRFDDGFSPSDRLFLQEASVRILGVPVRNTSCRDCYRDAYLEILHKLKKQGTMPKEKKFILRAGVLLHYNGEAYVNDNLTDDIAMDALNDNKGRLDLFQKVPDNLDEVLAARKAVKAEKKPADDTPKEELIKQIEGLKAVNAELTGKLEGAEKTFEAKEAEIAALKEAVEKGKAEAGEEIARLNSVIEAKEAEIAALKEAGKAEEKKGEAPADQKPAEEAAPAAEAPAEEAGKTKAAAKK